MMVRLTVAQGQSVMESAWQLTLYPHIIIFQTVLEFNVGGDACGTPLTCAWWTRVAPNGRRTSPSQSVVIEALRVDVSTSATTQC